MNNNRPETKIFLVDDQKITNFINKKLITLCDKSITVCDYVNPLEAFKSITAQNPDLILLDLNMPEISGWDFLEKMKNSQLEAKVIIVTSSTSALDSERAKEFKNVVDYFIKPIDKNLFSNLLEKHLNKAS